MKKLYFLIIMACFLTFCSSKTRIVEKIDKPLKGEWDFKLTKAWETAEIGNNIMAGVKGLGINKEGNIILWDSKQATVFICNPKGEVLTQFGRRGEGPGETMDKWATRLFLTDECIVLHEVNTGRIQFYSHKGEFIETKRILKMKFAQALKAFIDVDRFLFFLSGDATDKDENILGIYNLSTNDYQVIARMPADKPLEATDDKGGNVSLQDPDIALTTICSQSDGEKVFYGKNNEYVIKSVDLKTKNLTTFTINGRKGREITEATKKLRFEVLSLDKQLEQILIRNCPDRTYFFNRIFIDSIGLMYVFVPDWEKKNWFELDIFSPSGKYLYHSIIKLPEEYSRIRNLTFHSNNLYFTAEDEEGEIKLVKYNIASPTI